MEDQQKLEAVPETPAELVTPQEDAPLELEIPKKPLNTKPGAVKLRGWLNKSLRVKMSDGRVLVGVFLCTDRDANVILGSCSEYLPENTDGKGNEEPRMLGLAMVPGKHIVSVAVDKNEHQKEANVTATPLPPEVLDEDVT